MVTLSDPTNVLPTFTAPSSNATLVFQLNVTDSGSLSSTDTATVTITDSTNSPPTVDAGDDQTVQEGDAVTLTGTASDDDPEDTLTYQWAHDSSLTITLADSTALSTTFTAPNIASNATVTFTLTVNDGDTVSTDTITVIIADTTPPNRAPIADIGSDLTLTGGSQATITATASDPDGDSLTYQWRTSPTNVGVVFGSPNSLTTTITVPEVDGETRIAIILQVGDGTEYFLDAIFLTITDSAQ